MIMLTVVIVNFKTYAKTIEFVNEILPLIDVRYKVVIVDNMASYEDSLFLANALQGCLIDSNYSLVSENQIYIINSKTNLGFAKVKSEYLLFSNNDIRILTKHNISLMIKMMEEDSTIGIIGPKVIGLRGELQSPEPYMSFLNRYLWMELSTPFLSLEKKRKIFKLDYKEKAKEGFHYKLMGSFFMVRTHDFIRCGMMDPATFLYAEEVILTERMKRVGLKPYYYPKVEVLHEHGATTSKYIKYITRRRIQFESEKYYYKTYIHTPLFQLWLGSFFQFFMRLIRR